MVNNIIVDAKLGRGCAKCRQRHSFFVDKGSVHGGNRFGTNWYKLRGHRLFARNRRRFVGDLAELA